MRKKSLFIKKALTFSLVGAMAFSTVYTTGIANVTAASTTYATSNGTTGINTNLFNQKDSYFTNAIYVAPNGSANGSGTSSSPMDLQTALNKVSSVKGATILLKSGTYKFNSQITIDKSNSGTASAYKVLKAAYGANVTLDFSGESYSTTTSLNARGIQLNANYWYISGITIYGAADNGMMLSGSHNIIERCVFNANRDTGLQISRSSSSVTNYADWPSYNTIINCTSKNNCDPATYENADGFAAKLTCGDGNVFDGCISHNNSDDGWDLYAKTETGPIGIVTIRNCIAMRNGKTEDGTTKSSCDGNGFKLGGSGVGTPHVVDNCIAIENLHHGFTDNNNPSALKITNCTAFNNNQGGSKNNFSLYRCKDAYVSNCISYTTNKTSDKFVNLSAEYTVFYNSSKWYKVTQLQTMDTGSSSSRGTAISTGVQSSDFISVSVPSVGTNFDTAWRNADGTIHTNGITIVSSSSTWGTFSSDGGACGASFGSNNKTSTTNVAISNSAVTPGTSTAPSVSPSPSPSTTPSVSPSPSTSTTPSVSPSPSNTPAASTYVQNFTADGKDSSYFSITGNLSDSKGSVTYNGLTLDTCLKMESATSVKFTTTKAATLTLIANSGCTRAIKVDGTKYSFSNGTLKVSLAAGSHTITKQDSNVNLYYMSVAQ